MKNYFLTVLSAAIVSFNSYGANSPASAEKKFVCSDGYTSNLRSGPDTSSMIVTKLSKYTPLMVLEEKEQWTKVKTESFEGWVYNTLIDKSINCVLSTKSYKTQESYTSDTPHRYREKVLTGEGFQVIKAEMGMTQVKDKTGNVFWLENHVLWPKSKLQSLHL